MNYWIDIGLAISVIGLVGCIAHVMLSYWKATSTVRRIRKHERALCNEGLVMPDPVYTTGTRIRDDGGLTITAHIRPSYEVYCKNTLDHKKYNRLISTARVVVDRWHGDPHRNWSRFDCIQDVAAALVDLGEEDNV